MTHSLTASQKTAVVRALLSTVSRDTLDTDMATLMQLRGKSLKQRANSRSTLGNDIVNYFTLRERLETRGKYNMNFYDFVAKFPQLRRTKHFIATLVAFYERDHPHWTRRHLDDPIRISILKRIYNIGISAINIQRPLTCMYLYDRYGARRILSLCSGWGASLVAAAAMNCISFTGIENNTRLRGPYLAMEKYLHQWAPSLAVRMVWDDAATISYHTLTPYDFIFSSPPYYFIEKYSGMPDYADKNEMDEQLIRPMFLGAWSALSRRGHMAINTNRDMYDRILRTLFGRPADETLPFNKSSRQNDYEEKIYIWRKP